MLLFEELRERFWRFFAGTNYWGDDEDTYEAPSRKKESIPRNKEKVKEKKLPNGRYPKGTVLNLYDFMSGLQAVPVTLPAKMAYYEAALLNDEKNKMNFKIVKNALKKSLALPVFNADSNKLVRVKVCEGMSTAVVKLSPSFVIIEHGRRCVIQMSGSVYIQKVKGV